MKTWNDLKEKCEESERFNNLTKKELKLYRKEIIVAKRFYENGRNLYEELHQRKEEVQNNYTIPYLLELTDKITDSKKNYIQVKNGSSGGKLNATLYRNIS